MSKPRIRVKGFENDWDSRQLGEISEKVSEKNSAMAVTEVFTNSASLGVISQRDYFNHDIANQDNIGGYQIVSENDFVYNPRVSVTAPVGPISRNRLGRKGVMSPLYSIFRTHDINRAFLEHYFKTSYWYPFMRYNGNTGARFDRFAISDANFFKMPIPYPEPEEQTIIADTIADYSTLLHKVQGKITRLNSLKICYLTRLFPIRGGYRTTYENARIHR